MTFNQKLNGFRPQPIDKTKILKLKPSLYQKGGEPGGDDGKGGKGTTDEEEDYDDGLPKSFDWHERGLVTPVKDQGVCGSCYAFSSVAALEAAYDIWYSRALNLSEQEIVDCSR